VRTMSNFKTVKLQLELIAQRLGVPKPQVTKALPSDPCDVTDPPHIRIKTVRSLESDYQARHVFGHYLCDLHATDDPDAVADIIALLLRAVARGCPIHGEPVPCTECQGLRGLRSQGVIP